MTQRRRAYRSSLRAEQAETTRQKILDALAALIAEGQPHTVSISAIAERAGVAEPTVFHHFPTKQALFQALATRQFRLVTEGLDPRRPKELAEAIRTVYRRSAEIESLVRWTISNPLSGSTERPHRGERQGLLRAGLGPVLEGMAPADAQNLERLVLLLSSPLAALYWKDYLGLSADEAADVAVWTLAALAPSASPESSAASPES